LKDPFLHNPSVHRETLGYDFFYGRVFIKTL